MTRSAVYGAALVAAVAATTLTTTATFLPSWISYIAHPSSGPAVYDRIGLHQRCTSATSTCFRFPDAKRCGAGDDGRAFCSVWRTAGWLMSLAIVINLASLVGFVVIMAGGKMKREKGWRVLCVLLGVVATLQVCAMGVVSYMFDNDDFFMVPGYGFDRSFYACMASAVIAGLTGCGLAISAFVLAPEGGYIFLENPSGV